MFGDHYLTEKGGADSPNRALQPTSGDATGEGG